MWNEQSLQNIIDARLAELGLINSYPGVGGSVRYTYADLLQEREYARLLLQNILAQWSKRPGVENRPTAEWYDAMNGDIARAERFLDMLRDRDQGKV